MEGLCLNGGIIGIASPITVSADVRTNPTHVTAAVGRSSSPAAGDLSSEKTAVSPSPAQRWGFSFKSPLRPLWPGNRSRHDAVALDDAVSVEEREEKQEESRNWVSKFLHVRSLRKEEEGVARVEEVKGGMDQGNDEVSGEDNCDVCNVRDDDEEADPQFDTDSFSKLLRKVSLAEAKLYAQMSYLGNLAYCIPRIKPGNLLKNYGLRFVTSSLENKQQEAMKTDEKTSKENQQESKEQSEEAVKSKEEKSVEKNKTSESFTVYQIAASAASHLHSHTMTFIPFRFNKPVPNDDSSDGDSRPDFTESVMNAEVASLMASTDSVTAVVAAKEEVKQAVADDLNSSHSSPCEWFICDDDQSITRFFVIQGSESLASWQANLLFEPTQFEGLDVIVHRGIYEAAKGMYKQMLPEVQEHLKCHGDRATFRFTGHSLGGSLSLLLSLMLLIRGQVPISSLLPVITFGAPSIMCGGNRLLRQLGLPRSHLQAIAMHRDIVPRAFSCNYPKHVAELLKAVNGNFRNHPCLNSQSLLYAPMGEFLILQPDDKYSPSHHLLPSGSGLYMLSSCAAGASEAAEKQISRAQLVFLNSPHPLEILSDRSAYGSGGMIQRDHDMNSYLKALRIVIRNELSRIRKAGRERRRRIWWPLVAPHGVNGLGRGARVDFSGTLRSGRESLKQFTTLVASQHVHLLVMLIVGAGSAIGFT